MTTYYFDIPERREYLGVVSHVRTRLVLSDEQLGGIGAIISTTIGLYPKRRSGVQVWRLTSGQQWESLIEIAPTSQRYLGEIDDYEEHGIQERDVFSEIQELSQEESHPLKKYALVLHIEGDRRNQVYTSESLEFLQGIMTAWEILRLPCEKHLMTIFQDETEMTIG